MLLYLFDFKKVFFEGASKSSTAFFTVYEHPLPQKPSSAASVQKYNDDILDVFSSFTVSMWEPFKKGRSPWDLYREKEIAEKGSEK